MDAQPPTPAYFVSASRQWGVSLLAGLVAGIVVAAKSCAVSAACTSAGSCVATGFCAFRNVVPPTADESYDADTGADALASILRGVCSPGDRQQRSLRTGQTECVPFFPYPSALNAEIQSPNASQPHMRACGKWIDAGGLSLSSSVTTRGFLDHDSWFEVVKSAEDRATDSSKTAKDAMAKFRAECKRTVRAGARGPATVLGYKHLVDAIGAVNDTSGLLRATGVLSAHSCEAPAVVGVFLAANGVYVVDVVDGYLFYPHVLATALHIVGEPYSLQQDAERANAVVALSVGTAAASGIADWYQVASGAIGGDRSGFAIQSSTGTSVLDSLAAHVAADPAATSALVRGYAAYCAHSAMELMQPAHDVAGQASAIRSSRPRAAALGRIESTDDDVELEGADVLAASTVTLTQLPPPAAGDGCLNAMRMVFPDDVDAARFSQTVGKRLYDRLQLLTVQIRLGLQLALLSVPLRNVLGNATQIAADVAQTGFRIAGAPRGSWAGIARAVPDAGFSSEDGAVTMMLKQARAVTYDRVHELVIRNADPCDHPPFSSSDTLNAYAIFSLKCTVLFLGMAKRPWLDSQYDEASIASRGGMVIAHELAHMTLRTTYVEPDYSGLLGCARGARGGGWARSECTASRTGTIAGALTLRQSPMWGPLSAC